VIWSCCCKGLTCTGMDKSELLFSGIGRRSLCIASSSTESYLRLGTGEYTFGGNMLGMVWYGMVLCCVVLLNSTFWRVHVFIQKAGRQGRRVSLSSGISTAA